MKISIRGKPQIHKEAQRMSQIKKGKYSEEQKSALIKEYLEKKAKDPEYSRYKFSYEKGISESTFRSWTNSLKKESVNEIICIKTVESSSTEKNQNPKITIKTKKSEITIENIEEKEIVEMLWRIIENGN